MQLPSLQAQFGGDLPSDGLVGWLWVLTGSDAYGCQPLTTPAPANGSFIAVIKRGPANQPCEFDEKVRTLGAVRVAHGDEGGALE